MSKGHAVIDGSNLATEGRSEPNLAQLNEAVAAIADEYDFAQITVIVDATFEHRVDKSETKAARKAVDDGKIITPPAGVIGRGDAFILQVADRADAVVFSNDSFQEFHAIYDWLFDEGRLIGGKPIPAVGWIYVPRSPVRGPVSRRVTADKRRKESPKPAKAESSEKAAEKAAEKEKAPSDEPKPRRGRGGKKATAAPAADDSGASSASSSGDGSNDRAAWKEFQSDYPIGSTIAATVDRFASHGAYGSVGDVVIYLPNRLLANPAPSKARDVVDLGDTVDFIVHRYDDERNGIDAGLIAAPGAKEQPAKTAPKKPARRRVPMQAPPTPAQKPAVKPQAKKAATKKTVAKAPTKKAAAKKPAAKAPAKKATRRRVPMQAPPAPAKKAVTTAPARKTPAKKTPAKKTAAKKTAAKKVTVKKSAAKKTAAKKPAAKKSSAKKAATEKAAKKRR